MVLRRHKLGDPDAATYARPTTSPHRTPLHVTWHQKHSRSLTFGERAADVLRNSMGSWRLVFGFLAFMLVWTIVNSFEAGWDEHPFILLNLFSSMLAGLQGRFC